MVSSFPKMQKSSASFSQSVRNRLRLKKLQAQAKNFCRVLDIRVPQKMNACFLNTALMVILSNSFIKCASGHLFAVFITE